MILAGLCECGCGRETPLAKETKRGAIKGQPNRYLRGHNRRGARHSLETRAKLSAFVQRQHDSGALPRFFGDANVGWKGGRTTHKGRTLILVGRDHPMADRDGYVPEHRLVLAAALGRFLASEEHVHHINGDHTDNRPENLMVVNRSEHMRIHMFIRDGLDPVAAICEVLA